ncbi:hypothetical protein INR49_026157 [Caranx melampygus]|nr:hypothetical protein INR49_026157 [Caranx melampygus]
MQASCHACWVNNRDRLVTEHWQDAAGLRRRVISSRRHVQILSLLCAVCRLTLAFPTQTPSAYDDVHSLQVNIPHSGPVFAPLGSSISIPCFVSLSSTPTTSSSSSAPVEPRVKWTVVSGGVETQILVARGHRVKVNEAYIDRAALLNHSSSSEDVSLWLGDLRSSDSGHYRCEVQQGLEDASDIVQLKVKGVVFHYRDALGRYAFSFHQAQMACEAIGADIATADQLLAAYYDGYEQCDAGWLADQSVRYPIQVPREGCYGDMDGQPGVRNYGTMDPDDLFDVYCYVEQIDGEVFHDPNPQQLSFDEAQSYCRAAGGELATTAQLYLAWSKGLDRCSPGWLSDGSVRYPIIKPRDRCGGPQAGVKTLYRYSNQTGFPEMSSLHDVYCFKDHRIAPTDSAMDYMATEAEDFGQDVVILTETDQELHLTQHAEQVEREAQSLLESFPFVSQTSTGENLVDTHSTVKSDTTESPLNTTSTLDFIKPLDETSSPTEMSSQDPALMNSTSSTETYNFPQNTSLLPSVYNEADSHQNFNFTFHQFELVNATEFPEPSYEPHTDNLTAEDVGPEEHTQPSERLMESQEVQETSFGFNSSQANYSMTDSNYTQEENILEATSVNPDNMFQVKMEEAAVAEPWQTSPLTQSPRETSSAPAETQSVLPDPTSSSGPQNIDKLGLSIFSTAAQLWESPSSKQEGSTSVETEDTVTMESEEKQLHPTEAEDNLVSGVSLATTESPDGSNTSQLPPDSTTAQYQTSSYRVYLESATTAYEEASGEEPEMVTAILGEDIKVAPTLEEHVTVSQILEEEGKVSSTNEEEAEVSFSLEQEVRVSPTPEEDVTVTPNLGNEVKVAPTMEEEAKVSFSLEEKATVVPTHEEETNAPVLEEAHIAPTIEEATFAPTLEEANVAPTLEEEAVSPIIKEQDNISPTLEVEATTSTNEEEEEAPTLEDKVDVPTPIEEEAIVASTPEVSFTSVEEEEANFTSAMEEDYTILPYDSQTSKSALLTTTTAPQESLNGHEYNRETSSITSTAAPSTKSTTATSKTTTHWSRRTWSPTTSTPRVLHKTTESQKVMHLIPPVDQGLVDVEFSLTQPPTLLILPNERAAVGGAGRASDACVDNPCFNGGTCTDQDGQIKCLCLPTYGGDFCQTDLERCEPGWDKFHGFCYRHFSQRLSWEVAEQHCRMQGAHLVSIMTPEEQNYINSNYKEYQWTGLNDKTIEDDFRWSDGNPLLYENWYRGQPDSYFLSGEDCVVMVWHDDGRWSDVPCNYHLAYTCKKGTSLCGPPPKVRNASIFGKSRQRYETNAVVRYHCADGFQQRLNPLIRCLPGGMWERPQILCFREPGGPTQHPEVTSLTNGFAAAEDEFEATKEKPQYWDIKF